MMNHDSDPIHQEEISRCIVLFGVLESWVMTLPVSKILFFTGEATDTL